MTYSKELESYHQQLVDAVAGYNETLIDDLECLLAWMDPNDDHNNHRMEPPSLRIKNSIKLLEFQEGKKTVLVQTLRQWILSQVRFHFFHFMENLEEYNDMVNLEKYYEFPLKYVNIFSQSELNSEIVRLRKYLLNRNPKFRSSMEERIRTLILYEDDFETAFILYNWMVKGLGHHMVKFVIDLLTGKVELFCQDKMEGNVDQGNVISRVFNSFVEKWWSQFIQLLQFPNENDQELSNLAYGCFEKKFIKIKSKELFNEIIPKFPISKPALLEMKDVIKCDSYELDRLVAQICRGFDTQLLIPSVTTIEILLYYVKAIKCLMVIDSTGRSLNRFTFKLKPKIKERSDLIITVLCAILELDSDEIIEVISKNTLTENPVLLGQLSRELKDSIALNFHSVSSIKTKTAVYSVAHERQDPVVKQFLEWTPEPGLFKEDVNKAGNINDDDTAELLELPKDVLEVVFQVFDSPEVLVNEFIKLITNHMLQMDGYVLSAKWSQLLKTLMNKYFRNNKQVLKSICEESNLVNVFVMWSDLEKSTSFQNWSSKLQLVPSNVYPKIISYLYWKISRKSQFGDYKLPPSLSTTFLQMEKAFEMKSPGRKLRFQKDQGTVDLLLTFEDGRQWANKVSIPKYTVLELFQRTRSGLSIANIVQAISMSQRHVEEILQYWCQEHVLFQRDKGSYAILENESREMIPSLH
ncbi:HBR069Wp [Eremothecium sinecaudum]|uniref:HBR069Wp n=1 Tax=Eremothecium sinecaudum TaxID=45286 RepID=A0A125RDZ2_9SACH|nr:HBR069Wp [Eremothecium sinecaudum]AMD18970.1 HBR069Wp [Eremothecium sinecaudum]